jgi:hypothetical protein
MSEGESLAEAAGSHLIRNPLLAHLGSAERMTAWGLWSTASAAIAFVLIVLLLTRYVLDARLSARYRKTLDLLAAPLFVLFVLYIITDFLRGA